MDERATTPGTVRREPTAAEARALAHPLRMRILFACRERARTNKELAAALGTTPGTVHYHLKPLVEQGFLRAEEPRPGPRGSTEQPYRSTGKSWQVSGTPESSRALLEAGATEVMQVADDDVLSLSRLGMSLSNTDLDDLLQRLHDLVEEFAGRSRTAPDPPEAVHAAEDGAEDADAEPAGDAEDADDGADDADAADADEVESVTLFLSVHRSPGVDGT